MHPSDLARLEHEAHTELGLGPDGARGPVVRPGSMEEAAALERIDELREEDMAGIMRRHPDMLSIGGARKFYRRGAPESTRRTRRAASERYWRRHARP